MAYLKSFDLKILQATKLLILVFLIVLPFGFFNLQSEEILEINPQNANYYQENSCKFSLFDINSKNIDSIMLNFYIIQW